MDGHVRVVEHEPQLGQGDLAGGVDLVGRLEATPEARVAAAGGPETVMSPAAARQVLARRVERRVGHGGRGAPARRREQRNRTGPSRTWWTCLSPLSRLPARAFLSSDGDEAHARGGPLQARWTSWRQVDEDPGLAMTRTIDPADVAARFRGEIRAQLEAVEGPLRLVGVLAGDHGPSTHVRVVRRAGLRRPRRRVRAPPRGAAAGGARDPRGQRRPRRARHHRVLPGLRQRARRVPARARRSREGRGGHALDLGARALREPALHRPRRDDEGHPALHAARGPEARARPRATSGRPGSPSPAAPSRSSTAARSSAARSRR